jgi:hypothetical protein
MAAAQCNVCSIGCGFFDREKKKKPKDARNQLRDVLIAETAIKNRAILVSGNLRIVMSEFGGEATA